MPIQWVDNTAELYVRVDGYNIVVWEPETDITPYELSLALPYLLLMADDSPMIMPAPVEAFDRLPDEVRRHFTVKRDPTVSDDLFNSLQRKAKG